MEETVDAGALARAFPNFHHGGTESAENNKTNNSHV
jgi:hypothetical protein